MPERESDRTRQPNLARNRFKTDKVSTCLDCGKGFDDRKEYESHNCQEVIAQRQLRLGQRNVETVH